VQVVLRSMLSQASNSILYFQILRYFTKRCNHKLNSFVIVKVQISAGICSVQIMAICILKFTAYIMSNTHLIFLCNYFKVKYLLEI
jgi:hypothetical protein